MAQLKVDRRTAIYMLTLSGIPAMWFSLLFLNDCLLLYRAQAWQQVDAVVQTAEKGSLPEDDGEAHTSRDLTESLAYGYAFNGNEIVAHRYGPFQTWNVGSNLRGLSTGSSITAYVNPDKPHEAVIDRTLRSGFGIVLVLTVLAYVWLAWALLAIFRDERFTRGFMGQLMVFVSALVFVAALLASGDERDTNWWLVAGGFLGGFALGGFSVIMGLWSQKTSATLALIAILFGITTGIIGIVRGGVRG